MKITNKLGLHKTVFNAVKNWGKRTSEPDPDYWRVTELIRPVQQVLLERRHHDKLETEAMDLLSAWLGSAAHELLSKQEVKNALQEETISAELEGFKIVGKPDHYEDGVLLDFKVTRVWSVIFGSRNEEWTQQLNIYRYMLKSMGFPVNRLEVICIFTDWSATKAMAEADYPNNRGAVVPIIILADSDVERWLVRKLRTLAACRKLPDAELPECTSAEMWEEPTKYAIMKHGNKRSAKNFEDKGAAIEHTNMLNEKKGNSGMYYVDPRPGKRRRCEDYCSAAPFCQQYKAYRVKMDSLEGGNDE